MPLSCPSYARDRIAYSLSIRLSVFDRPGRHFGVRLPRCTAFQTYNSCRGYLRPHLSPESPLGADFGDFPLRSRNGGPLLRNWLSGGLLRYSNDSGVLSASKYGGMRPVRSDGRGVSQLVIKCSAGLSTKSCTAFSIGSRTTFSSAARATPTVRCGRVSPRCRPLLPERGVRLGYNAIR